MSCRCGSSGGGAAGGSAGGVLLSGSLDARYGQPGTPGQTPFSSAAKAKESRAFWVVFAFLLIGAWLLDRESESE